MRNFAIGCDIGGSHISCAVIDVEKEIIRNETYATKKVDNKASSEEILNDWATALRDSLGKIDKNLLAGIGFAMPGPFEYDKGIARFTNEVAKYENLNGIDVGNEIKKLLELDTDSDVRFMNDATSFAVGEAWLGRAAGAERSVSITLGTGFGSAFIDNGIPVVERNDVPKLGCVWHLPFKKGIADDYFSTRWFLRRYAEKSGWEMEGVKGIANRAVVDPRAKVVFEEFGQNLGEFLGTWMKKFGANTLVIGGNISASYNLFGPNFEMMLREQGIDISVYISELMEDAALIGSAKLFNENFWGKVKPLLSKM